MQDDNKLSKNYTLIDGVDVSKRCYNETEKTPIYGEVIRSRNTYGKSIEYINNTFCSDFPINKSCSSVNIYNYSANIVTGTETYTSKEIVGYDTITKLSIACNNDIVCGAGYKCLDAMNDIAIVRTDTNELKWSIPKKVKIEALVMADE